MRPLVIVDGYNVIHADEKLKVLARDDLELARIKLIEKLAEYAISSGEEIKVVFDASKNKSAKQIRTSQILGIEVIFSRSGETADAVLEKVAFKAVDQQTVFVVTSDFEEQKVLFAKGVYRRTPAEFFRAMEKTRAAFAMAAPKKKRQFLEDRLDEEGKQKLRRLARPEIEK